MVLPALALVAGAACVFGFERLPSPVLLGAVAAGAALAWSVRLRALACGLAGFLLAGVHGHLALAGDWPCARDREVLELTGRIVAPPLVAPGRVDFEFAPEAAGQRQSAPRRIRLSWYEPEGIPSPGERWQLSARLRCRNGLLNPGGYDRELALLRARVGATGYVVGRGAARIGGGPHAAPVAWLRHRIAERVAHAAAGTGSAGVLQGLTVGLRGNIPDELDDAFVATGTAHLIAISGMHVTAFAVAFHLLMRFGYRIVARPALSAAWPAWQALTVLAVTAGYGLLAGAALPAVRTVAMVGIALLLRLARRRVPVGDLLAAAGAMLVAADPLSVTSAGFWLSFGAVAALVALIDTGASAWAWLWTFMRAQAAVTVVLAPVLLAAFGAVSLVGPLVNAVAIPLFSFVLLPLTLAGMALMPLAGGGADALWGYLARLLDALWPWLIAAGRGALSTFAPPQAPGWLLGATLVTVLAGIVLPVRGLRLVASVLLAATLLRPAAAPPQGGFELTVVDVGQGLAAIVRTARHSLVFDTGPRWQGGGSAARVSLVPTLRALGVRRLDRVVVSHADNDHAGGLEDLLRAIPAAQVTGAAGPGAVPCTAGDGWTWDGVGFRVVHPGAGETWNDNDGSCALRVASQGGVALLLADTQHRAERAMLSRDLAADVVLVPHHGSASSSSPAFVAAVAARSALVSAGYGNRWGLPRDEVVERWHEGGAAVHTTAAGGALQVRFTTSSGAGPVLGQRDVRRWWRR